MDRAAGSGLEVEPDTGLQIADRPNVNKYWISGGASSHPISSRSDTSNRSHQKRQGPFRTVWMLAVIAIVCLAIALGAGLGAGLAAQHKSSSSSGTASATIRATNAPVAVTQSGTTITISSTPATLPSASCPAANGSTYTATNKPLPTFAPELGLQVASTSLLFEILCNTNLAEENGHIIDIQLIPNVSTLNDCLEECALYSFRTKLQHFPANACTAVAWGTYDALQEAGDPWPVCWLKSNATLESANQTNTKGTTSGAVLLGFDS